MPSHADAHRLLGLMLHAAGRKEERISELRAAIKLNPGSLAKEDLKKLKQGGMFL